LLLVQELLESERAEVVQQLASLEAELESYSDSVVLTTVHCQVAWVGQAEVALNFDKVVESCQMNWALVGKEVMR
jgi:hypothetical protein